MAVQIVRFRFDRTSHAATLAEHGVGLITALVLSTAVTLAVTALVFVKVAGLGRREDAP